MLKRRFLFMSRLDEFRRNNKLAIFISKFANSFLYPALFAAICALSGVSGKDIFIPCLFALTALVVITGIFSEDLKVFLVPAIMIYYAIGMDVPQNFYEKYTEPPTFDSSAIPVFFICGALIVAVLLFRLISGKYLKEMLTKRGIFFWGFIFIAAALLIGGLFCREWSYTALLFAALIGACFIIFYLLFVTILSHSKDSVAYLCKILVCLGFAISIQILVICYRLHLCDNFIFYFNGSNHVNRKMLSLSWGLGIRSRRRT